MRIVGVTQEVGRAGGHPLNTVRVRTRANRSPQANKSARIDHLGARRCGNLGVFRPPASCSNPATFRAAEGGQKRHRENIMNRIGALGFGLAALLAASSKRVRAKLSHPDRPHCGAFLRRQHYRRTRAHPGRQALHHVEAAGHRREPPRSAGNRRRCDRRQGRLHADADLQRAHDRARDQQVGAVRSGEGFCGRERGGVGASGGDRAAGFARQDAQGFYCTMRRRIPANSISRRPASPARHSSLPK